MGLSERGRFAAKTLPLLCLVVALWVCIAGLLSSEALAESASMKLEPNTGSTGAVVSISGSGWPAGEVVALYIDSPGRYLGQPGPVADASGGFVQSIRYPGKQYDPSGKIDPTTPGPHQICGDTSYPGSTQAIEAKACATFTVFATASPSPSPRSSASPQLPVPAVLAAFVVLAALVGALMYFTRRSG